MPKTKEQFEKMKDKRLNSILDSSLYLFAAKGYDAIKTDDITEYIGCSHGLIYHYFDSKEELFQTLMEKKVRVIVHEIVKDVDLTLDPATVLTGLSEALLAALRNENDEYACAVYLSLNLHMQRKYAPRGSFKGKMMNPYGYLYNLIEKGKECGQFYDNNTKEILISLLSFYKGIAYSRIFLGAKRFICPKCEIALRMIIK